MVERNRRKLLFTVALCIAIGLTFSEAELGLFRLDHFLSPAANSLLHGFAPLIGVMILNGILAHLFFRLVCSVEKELSQEDDSLIPDPDKKHEWHHLHTNPVTFVTAFLSQTEHSPPAVALRLI